MKDKYLRETRMVDFSNPAIQKLIQTMKWKEMGEFERIKAIYNYVRDDILDIILMTEFQLQKYLQMVMDNVILNELYSWHFYVPVIFHAEYMVLRLIKACRKEL